jgi:hypothetical protein
MQRRIDQLTSELRTMRGGGDGAARMEDLEERVSRLERDNRALEEKNRELQRMAEMSSADYSGPRVNINLSRTEEVVTGLNDVLSELRINVLAAEGEIENWAHILPVASFELVRESLRSSRMQMESARDIMQMLRSAR